MDTDSVDLVLQQVGQIPENIVAKITASLLKILNDLQDGNALRYTEIKPSNILIKSNGEIKFSGCGISGTRTDSTAHLLVGTRSYMPPERLEGTMQGTHYSFKSIAWSLGLSLVEMATGVYPIPPPDAKTQKPETIFELLDYIVTKPPPTLPKGSFSAEFEDFVGKCLSKDPHERADLKTLLKHKWILKAGADNVSVGSWLSKTMKLPPLQTEC
ncbi:hypothetical protein Zmor_005389 [Zophobas morio]|uniref:Protein kinase domain-containing protein n=2 Tax=Zophobas morio TaxID=2755281 RepID=A0AA38IT50_9CUCU|nr:hypothetical protein Zmor_005389 [Zophobas morio]